jgi:hypothetical protein
MELVWDSRASTLQESTDSTNSSTQHRQRGAQVSRDNCDDILCFLEDFGVIVCKQHHTAVVNLNTHLLQHHSVPATARRQIVERFSMFSPVDPSEIQLPDELAQPIEELGKPLDGLQCKTCGFITTNKDTVRMHCKKKHKQAWRGETSMLYNTVKV